MYKFTFIMRNKSQRSEVELIVTAASYNHGILAVNDALERSGIPGFDLRQDKMTIGVKSMEVMKG